MDVQSVAALLLKFTELNDAIPIEVRTYIAGHFDGEGNIMCKPQASGKVYVQIQVRCSHLPVLELYKVHFSGNIQLVDSR